MSATIRPIPPPCDKSFDGIDLKLMGAYRTWDNVGQAVSRGQPL